VTTPATLWSRISAITRRDARIELSYHFQLAMRYFSTLLSVAVFFFIGKLVRGAPELEPYSGGYFAFALIGLVVTAFATIALREVSRTFTTEASAGTLEILLAGPTPLSSIIAGSLVVPLGIGVTDMVIYLAAGFFLGGVAYTLWGALLAIPILVLTILSFVAVGIFATAFLVLTRRGEPLSFFVLGATSLLAGTLFPVALLPEPLQALARLFPAFYGLNALRAVLLGGAGLEAVWDEILVLVIFNLVLFPMSMWVLRQSLRQARVLGTLVSS
jgi:ABC-2 type transport system permease protein